MTHISATPYGEGQALNMQYSLHIDVQLSTPSPSSEEHAV